MFSLLVPLALLAGSADPLPVDLTIVFPTERSVCNMPAALNPGFDCECQISDQGTGTQWSIKDGNNNNMATTLQHKWASLTNGKCTGVPDVECNAVPEGEDKCRATLEVKLAVTSYLVGPNWVGWADKHGGDTGMLTYTGNPSNDTVTLQDSDSAACSAEGSGSGGSCGFWFKHGGAASSTNNDGFVTGLFSCAQCAKVE